jgi:hypothetical protein
MTRPFTLAVVVNENLELARGERTEDDAAIRRGQAALRKSVWWVAPRQCALTEQERQPRPTLLFGAQARFKVLALGRIAQAAHGMSTTCRISEEKVVSQQHFNFFENLPARRRPRATQPTRFRGVVWHISYRVVSGTV